LSVVYPIVVSPWKIPMKSMFQGLNSARFTIVRQTQISCGYLNLCKHTKYHHWKYPKQNGW
jgi:hypothetical protein